MKMNFVLFGFGLGLVIIGVILLWLSTPIHNLENKLAWTGVTLLGIGILISIIAGWLIEREHTNRKAQLPPQKKFSRLILTL